MSNEELFGPNSPTAKMLLGEAFLLKTPACQELVAHILDWIEQGSRGAIIYGLPGLGKTCATLWVLAAIERVLGPIPWIHVPVRTETIATERKFFRFILERAKHRFQSGTTGDVRERVDRMLFNRANGSSSGMIIVVFDEAQLLSELHWGWIRNITNEARARVFFLFVGQHELVNRRTSFIEQGLAQFVTRYMADGFCFPAIASRDDVGKVLGAYDQARYPKVSGPFFPAIYLPEAVARGWCLEHLDEPLWNQLQATWGDCGGPGEPTLSMLSMARIVANVLKSARRSPELIDKTERLIQLAVERAGYASEVQTFLAIPERRRANTR